MPEVEYTVQLLTAPERVWAFVEDFENWAPYLVGFQKLDVVDDRISNWTVRGDLGVLSREVSIRAEITNWDPHRRVDFELTGISEQLAGAGTFLLGPAGAAAAAEAGEADTGPAHGADATPGRWARIRHRWARLLLRRLTRRTAPARVAGAEPAPAPPDGVACSELTFRLQLTPGGAMGPMVEVLLGPMMRPAAEDLANGIRVALDGSR